MPGIATLVGRIGTMTVAHLDYSLSREARARVEADVTAQAIAAFRARASAYAHAFGFADYTLGEVTVSLDEPVRPPGPMFARARLAVADASEPLPVEPGKGSVTSSVSGSIRLTK